jgi:sorbose reductase
MAASQTSNGVPVTAESRESLVNRQLPEMTLSTGDETSKTALPLPIPHYLDATGRALYRFSVEGNAICM